MNGLIKETDKFMDKVAYIYDLISRPCSNERIEFLYGILAENGKNVFSDLSCSTGETIRNLSEKCNNRMIGIDFSKGMINICKKKNLENKNTDFIKCDMRDLSKINDKIDVMYTNSINWNQSIEDIRKVFIETEKTLEREGCFIVDIPNSNQFLLTPYPTYSNKYIDDRYIIIKTTQYLDKDKTDNNGTLKMLQNYLIIDKNVNMQYSYSHLLKIIDLGIDQIIQIGNECDFEVEYIKYNYLSSEVSENTNSIQIIFKKAKLEEEIYIKEIKPEMTQCRIIQVDKKIKESNDEISI